MIRTIPLIAFLFWQTLASGQSVRDVLSQALIVPHGALPAFYKGYLYFVDPASTLTIYSPDGTFLTSFTLERRNGILPRVESVAIETDGTMAVGWGPSAPGPALGGIEFRDARGGLIRSIETGTYIPAHLAFGDDHALWSFGEQAGAGNSYRILPEYDTVRKFSPEGKQMGSYLPRSLFPAGMQPGYPQWQVTRIAITHDRVRLVAYSGMSGLKQEYVELDLNGKLIGRWRIDDYYPGAAMTDDGRIYLSRHDSNAKQDLYFTLDRASSTWQPVALPISRLDYLAGADGNRLVFLNSQGGQTHVRWFNQPGVQ